MTSARTLWTTDEGARSPMLDFVLHCAIKLRFTVHSAVYSVYIYIYIDMEKLRVAGRVPSDRCS